MTPHLAFDFPLRPPSASTLSGAVDQLYLVLVGLSLFMVAAIFLSILYFAVKYREGSTASRVGAANESLALELTWTGIPLVIFLGLFFWGARLFYAQSHAPDDAVPIYVVGKQWMWKVQHPEGKREINALHVPLGQRVKLFLTSEDVIHDFYIPAFRVKRDVLPGRYQTLWFEATTAGHYRFYCSQYCGTAHAKMLGEVVVMEPARFAEWLAGGAPGESMAAAGERLFERLNCATCHRPGGRGPLLGGLPGRTVRLEGGAMAVADEAYLRESILNPGVKIVQGYTALMPTFQGQVNESQILQLIAYIKSLPPEAAP